MKPTFALRVGLILMMTGTISLAQTQPAEKPIEPKERTELFNGRDLSGWTSYLRNNTEASKVWGVKDGMITCVGTPNGYLRTDKPYSNYRVTVEFRFTKPGNSGVLVHMNPPLEKIWPMTLECQGKHNELGDMYLWSGFKARELTPATPQKIAEKIPRKGADPEKPVGEWNTYQVICSGDTVTIVVNGQEMNRATECSMTSGYIGIQSEGAGLEIRKVTLEPLGK